MRVSLCISLRFPELLLNFAKPNLTEGSPVIGHGRNLSQSQPSISNFQFPKSNFVQELHVLPHDKRWEKKPTKIYWQARTQETTTNNTQCSYHTFNWTRKPKPQRKEQNTVSRSCACCSRRHFQLNMNTPLTSTRPNPTRGELEILDRRILLPWWLCGQFVIWSKLSKRLHTWICSGWRDLRKLLFFWIVTFSTSAPLRDTNKNRAKFTPNTTTVHFVDELCDDHTVNIMASVFHGK